MKQRCAFSQTDLFRMHRSDPQRRIPEQIALIPLVRDLLLEILSGKTAITSRNEGGDDQDHG